MTSSPDSEPERDPANAVAHQEVEASFRRSMNSTSSESSHDIHRMPTAGKQMFTDTAFHRVVAVQGTQEHDRRRAQIQFL